MNWAKRTIEWPLRITSRASFENRPAEAMWLISLTNQIIRHTVNCLKLGINITVSIWKGRCDIPNCSTCKPIRLISHAFKVAQPTVDQRLQEGEKITPEQRKFERNKSTTDATHNFSLLAEKRRQKKKNCMCSPSRPWKSFWPNPTWIYLVNS